ncbi:MAG TPA: ATP-binding protein [Candidatus Sulfotelmatobacter sp.]|nr:ATP-binding protein [Candidatus Sulfotelmatobacter sp.]
MSLLRRYPWFAAAAGITFAFAVVCLSAHRSFALTTFADLIELVLLIAATAVAVANARISPGQQRTFWLLMSVGFLLWAINGAAWAIWEIVLRRPIPDPFAYDIALFFHAVPMFAAVAWRPDLLSTQDKMRLCVLNFLMLLGWWIFLYAFIVFPHQYVVSNVPTYSVYYDRLYGLENGLLLAMLAIAAATASGGWRRIYLHYLVPLIIYSVDSQLLDRATASTSYYSGSLFDVPLVGTLAWLTAVSLQSRHWDLNTVQSSFPVRWKNVTPRLAMLATLSLPVLGIWTTLFDRSAGPSRAFRIFVVLAAMVLLGALVFLRQYFQDQTLISLLRESRLAYGSEKQLQTQLVQKEKLASLGNLVAGAAHEINHPLQAVMSYSEELWTGERITEEQSNLLRKIVNQAHRTQELVANLLSFAQQAPREKSSVDVGLLMNRAAQMLEARRPPVKIDIHLAIESDLPLVFASANQLFQAFVEIIENAMDALEEAGGGSLQITAMRHRSEIVLQFSDNGPGLRDPERVFDPFYTTKPVGKGTGLGLSAVYGVIQDHNGQITCRNQPQGGALFTIRLPITAAPVAQGAGAAG